MADQDQDQEARELLAQLAAQLNTTRELDCPFTLTPPPLRPMSTRELKRLQPELPLG